jgi:hypothetical protein
MSVQERLIASTPKVANELLLLRQLGHGRRLACLQLFVRRSQKPAIEPISLQSVTRIDPVRLQENRPRQTA